MKYIDAERLRAEIERRREKCADIAADERNEEVAEYYRGKEVAYDETSSLITSLQQEQPERICPRCVYYNRTDDMCECPHGGMEYFINENGVYKCNMFEKVEQQEQQEQPEMDLEKEINSYCGTRDIRPVPDFMDAVARHFYELGLNAGKK